MNWFQRIEAARERGHFTAEDKELATEWVTCACGKLDERIPRNACGAPKDNELVHLGCVFCGHIDTNEMNAAAKTLDQIENRAVQLLEHDGRLPTSTPEERRAWAARAFEKKE